MLRKAPSSPMGAAERSSAIAPGRDDRDRADVHHAPPLFASAGAGPAAMIAPVSACHELPIRGPFSLRAAAEFGFGPTEGRAAPFDGCMRLAFPLDGGMGYAGA